MAKYDPHQEIILGFDARETWSNVAVTWPEIRKQASLFRMDIKRALSVDNEIWKSVFDVNKGVERPPWTGPVQQHWDSLDKLRKYLSTFSRLSESFWIIAVSLSFDSCGENGADLWKGRLSPFQPDKIDASWIHLGYDVADVWLESSLMNRVFHPNEDIGGLRKQWSPQLNDYHLFNDLESAFKFKLFSDKRSIEHAPFCVYSLWRIL